MNNIEAEKIFLIKFGCSLINDFFKKNNLVYSQSVFLPEIGIQDLFSENEIIGHFLEKYQTFDQSDDCILINLIKTVNKNTMPKRNQSSILIQTDSEPVLEVEDKLKLIDVKYLSKFDIERLMPSKVMEERSLKFQKELEARLKNEMQSEVYHLYSDC